jgi:hypothetical protein
MVKIPSLLQAFNGSSYVSGTCIKIHLNICGGGGSLEGTAGGILVISLYVLFLDGKNHLLPAARPDILALFTSRMQKKDSEFPTGT